MRADRKAGARTARSTSTTPQRDDATGNAASGRSASDLPYRDLKLPHERDQSAAPEPDTASDSAGNRDVTRQGAKDVAAGQQDTDCYNAVAPRYGKRERKGS